MVENDWKFRLDSPQLRDALCEFFEEKYGKIRFLEEKCIGKVRADMVAVLPDSLCGIEIKSHCDSYERLAGQVRGYDKFCNYNYLCVGSKHIHAEEHIPAHWGLVLMTVRDGVHFELWREPTKNPKCKLKNQLALLWRDELTHILVAGKLPRYVSKSKKFICDKLLETCEEETLLPLLCDRLFERDYSRYIEEE